MLGISCGRSRLALAKDLAKTCTRNTCQKGFENEYAINRIVKLYAQIGIH